MDYSQSWSNYISELHQYVQNQDKKIKDLEQRILNLENNEPANAKQTTIEKLEYHFDQLKIERLDGTLHIGLTPEDLSNVENLSLNQPSEPASNQYQVPFKQQMVTQLDSYLTGEGPALLEQIANESGIPLDHQYRSRILEDIRKQLPERIAFYEQNGHKQGMPENQEMSDFINIQVKNEIKDSLRNFFQNEQPKGE